MRDFQPCQSGRVLERAELINEERHGHLDRVGCVRSSNSASSSRRRADCYGCSQRPSSIGENIGASARRKTPSFRPLPSG